jgi:hypothetical protein
MGKQEAVNLPLAGGSGWGQVMLALEELVSARKVKMELELGPVSKTTSFL